MSAWTVPSYAEDWAVPGYTEVRELGRGASGKVVEFEGHERILLTGR